MVVALFTVRENVPELPTLFASPLKVPVIVCGEPDVLAGVYVTEQLVPDEIVQVVELNCEEDPEEVVKEKVSPTTEPTVPETEAVQTVPWPTTTGLVAQFTVAVVVPLLTVKENVPELTPLLPSPLNVPVIV